MLILGLLSQKPLAFSDIRKLTGLKDASVSHYVRKLIGLGLLRKTDIGTYKLVYKVPFCYLHDCRRYTYIGLLGYRCERMEPEPITSIKILEENGYSISGAYILTTKSAYSGWEKTLLDMFEVTFIADKDLLSIPTIEKKIERIVLSEYKKNPIILDCTALTKTATIAMYNIAKKYMIPLIYIYENTKEYYWVISIEDIRSELKSIFEH